MGKSYFSSKFLQSLYFHGMQTLSLSLDYISMYLKVRI